MKWLNKMMAAMTLSAVVFTACEKEGALPVYDKGTATTMALSTTTIAAPPADSNKVVLTVNWTNPEYATDSNNVKFIVQIDSAGRNFRTPVSRTIEGAVYQTSYTAKELNNIMLGYNMAFGVKGTLEMRVISSYANNNERLMSNVVPVSATPYKVPPKVVLPASGGVFIVGGGTDFGWSNDAGQPFNVARAFSRLDETTFAGIFNLKSGEQYLILPEYGNWGKKYALDKNSIIGIADGGEFGYHEDNNPAFAGFNDNFVTPAATGLYRITLDFQRGTFKVEPFTQQHGLPSTLVIVGGGTPQDWNNAVDNPYKFTRLSSSRWEQVVRLTANGEYLILPEPGNWGKKYGVPDNNKPEHKLGGKLVPEGSNFKTPDETANYKITLDFTTNEYKVVKQ